MSDQSPCAEDNGLEEILVGIAPRVVDELTWGPDIGAEKVMAVGDKLVPFSDRTVLEELLVRYRV